ncbi:LLM class flavin-dependent oxidoreductase [Sphingomonas sp. 4RDLI-65]|uniref:LLM class flavin-dependent oxidoreductase n=1 Tax=Sphingomonas sp. 4RDLI-65 TaxID=3111641 RepID=UPI003C236E92
MPLELTGLVSHNRGGPLAPRPQTDFDVAGIVASAVAQECAGYDKVLIANSALMPDSHAIATYVAANTTSLRMMIAHRPGFIAPTMAARMLATVDRLSNGRAAVHIIAGPSDTELEADGDFTTKDLRYARASEYVGILRRLWTSAVPVDHDGAFYRFNQAFMPVKPVVAGGIPVSWAGSSPASIEAAAEHADIFAMSGDSLAVIGAMVGRLGDAAASHQRTLDYMMTVIVILGDTEDAAWAKADAALAAFLALRGPTLATDDKGPSNFAASSDAGARVLATAAGGARQDRCLWMGMTHAAQGKFGNQTTLVGTPDQVTEALMDYYRLGVTRFLVRGYHPEADIEEYGRDLFPRLRRAVAAYDAAVGSV